MRDVRLSAATVCLLVGALVTVTGCGIQVQRIPAETAPNLENRESGPLPESVMVDVEAKIRALVKHIHKSQTPETIYKGGWNDPYRIEATLVSSQDDGYMPDSGREYRCSNVVVVYRFNYHDSYLDKANGRHFVSNTHRYSRTDEVCTYYPDGKMVYKPGAPHRLDE